jgi:hypothetical protein
MSSIYLLVVGEHEELVTILNHVASKRILPSPSVILSVCERKKMGETTSHQDAKYSVAVVVDDGESIVLT